MRANRLIGVVSLAILFISAVAAVAGDAVWHDDFEAAKAEAKKRDVPILVNFSGSDWCGWCKKLDREVLAKSEFKDYAKKSIVLFVADFPSKKKLAKKTVEQNKALQKEYEVQGFPTVLLLDAEGKEIARTGYKAGGPVAYVEHLKALLK